MEKVVIIRYSELHLKGKNRGYFERVLIINMEKALKGLKHEIKRQSGRYLVESFEEEEADEIISRLKKVFGIHSLSVAYLRISIVFLPRQNKCVRLKVRLKSTHTGQTKLFL